jgi:hypothetical protein
MPNKTLPTTGSTNWGETLNNFLTQSLDNTNGGGINKFDTFSLRPTTLGADDKGKTYLYTQTGNFHQWSGTEWKVLNESVINVKDYGAVGDGVSDDTVAIQGVINNIVSGKYIFIDGVGQNQNNWSLSKSNIFIPSGSYKVGTINLHAGISFVGEDIASTIFYHSGGNLPFIKMGNNVVDDKIGISQEVGNFTLVGTKHPDWRETNYYQNPSLTHQTSTAILMDGSGYQIRLRDMRILYCHDGINIKQSYGLMVNNVLCINCTNNGFLIENGCNLIDFHSCTSNSCGGNGFYIKDPHPLSIKLDSCDAEYCYENGLWLQDIANATIINCYFENNGWASTAPNGAKPRSEIKITYKNYLTEGVNIIGTVMRGLMGEGNNTGSMEDVLSIDYCKDLNISGCQFIATGEDSCCIRIGSEDINFSCQDNSFYAYDGGIPLKINKTDGSVEKLNQADYLKGNFLYSNNGKNLLKFQSISHNRSFELSNNGDLAIVDKKTDDKLMLLNQSLIQINNTVDNATSGEMVLRFHGKNANQNPFNAEIKGLIGKPSGYSSEVGLSFITSNPQPGGGANPKEQMRIDPYGQINFSMVKEYSDNISAKNAGLVIGDIYRTGEVLKIVF